jgi:hypothetical protein
LKQKIAFLGAGATRHAARSVTVVRGTRNVFADLRFLRIAVCSSVPSVPLALADITSNVKRGMTVRFNAAAELPNSIERGAAKKR